MRRAFLYTFLILLQWVLFSEAPPFQQEWREKNQVEFADAMKKLEPFFASHVKQHSVDDDFLVKVRDHFILLLDPGKNYLLESEIEPYVHSIQPFRSAWNTRSFQPFWDLFTEQMEAVGRAQSLRDSIMPHIRARSLPLYKGPMFAHDDEELLIRQTALLFSYVENGMPLQEAKQRLEAQEMEWKAAREDFSKALFLFRRILMRALTYSFDPHSDVLNSKEARTLKEELTKISYGTGIEVEETGRGVIVRKIIKGSPAAALKELFPGDRLLSLNRAPIDSLTKEDVHAILGGKRGPLVVTLTYKTAEDQIKTCTVPKRTFSLDEGRLVWHVRRTSQGDVLVITLDCFYKGSDQISAEKDFREAWSKACARHDIKGLVLDLRNNRGGFLLEAVKIAGLFIKSGVIVVVEYADGSKRFFRDLDPGVLVPCPVVVLTSRETASAAEIVAEALKEYGVGLVVGDALTFGKGTVQTETVTVKNQANSSQYKVTVGTYYSVGGKSLQGEGIAADIIVPGERNVASVGEQFLEGSLPKTSEIESSFVDTLQDVAASSLFWYRTYYVPFLQQPTNEWQKVLPELQKRSSERIGSKTLKAEAQVQEAISIVEDMMAVEKSKNKEELDRNCEKK